MNVDYKIVSSKNDFENIEKIVLPGVGAFDHAMTLLNNSGMRDSLDKLVLDHNIPIIGICVGMQILANKSEEGKLLGLGWIDGSVNKFDPSTIPYKTSLPHMGWNIVESDNENPLLSNLEKNPRFYFLHSYYFECHDNTNEIAKTNYGIQFTSAVNKNNIFGVQFHPEKSHHNGLQVLRNFAEI